MGEGGPKGRIRAETALSNTPYDAHNFDDLVCKPHNAIDTWI
jgi:hypothetical protein